MGRTLREVFVDWKFETNLTKELDKLDDSLESTAEEFEKMAADAERAARETADEWAKVGTRAASTGKAIAVGIGAGVAAFVTAGTAAVTFASQWAQMATQIETNSKRVGISADSLQEWQYAARSVGGEAEGIEGIFKELANRLGEVAATGTGSAADALALLKLRIQDLKHLKPEQQMEAIADRLSMISDVGARTFIKDSLFGGEYERIGSLLELGSAGIADLRKEANALGGVLDGDALDAAKNFNRELVKADTVVDGLKSTIAQGLLPVLRGWLARWSDLALANRELIGTKVDEWAKRLATWLDQIIPLIGGVADGIGKAADAVGGLDNAVKLAAGGWAAYQVAAMAALGPVGATIAAITAGITAAVAFADKYAGDPGAISNTKSKLSGSQEALRLQQRALDEAAKDDTFDPGIDEARRNFRRAAVVAAEEGRGATPAEQERLNGQLRRYEQALDAAYAADAAHAAEVDSNSAPELTLGRIAQPGSTGGTPSLTAESLLKEQAKREAERIKLRSIRSDLESRRATAGGDERMNIERTLSEVNKRLTGQDVQSPEGIIAGLMGQGTHLGAGALRPAGLGTSINQIDASITINLGGVDVDLPASMIDPSNPRGSAQGIGQAIMDALNSTFIQASRLQVSQIRG